MERDINGWYPITVDHCSIEPDQTDGLPKDGDLILIYDAGSKEIVVGYLWRGDNFRDHNKDGLFIAWQPLDDERYWKDFDPTHWQPLPNLPAG